MFGFNNKDNNKIIQEAKQRQIEDKRDQIHNAMLRTFGVSDPAKINKIWRQYMPEVTNAILNAEDAAVANNKTLANICEGMGIYHNELIEKIDNLEKHNQELQAKYDALVERMAGYIERENGKGR